MVRGGIHSPMAHALSPEHASPTRGMAHIGQAANVMVSRQKDIERQRHIMEARNVLDQRYHVRHAREVEVEAEAKAKLNQDVEMARTNRRREYLYAQKVADGLDCDSQSDDEAGAPAVREKSWLVSPWSWVMDMGCGECCQLPDKKDGRAVSRCSSRSRAFIVFSFLNIACIDALASLLIRSTIQETASAPSGPESARSAWSTRANAGIVVLASPSLCKSLRCHCHVLELMEWTMKPTASGAQQHVEEPQGRYVFQDGTQGVIKCGA